MSEHHTKQKQIISRLIDYVEYDGYGEFSEDCFVPYFNKIIYHNNKKYKSSINYLNDGFKAKHFNIDLKETDWKRNDGIATGIYINNTDENFPGIITFRYKEYEDIITFKIKKNMLLIFGNKLEYKILNIRSPPLDCYNFICITF